MIWYWVSEQIWGKVAFDADEDGEVKKVPAGASLYYNLELLRIIKPWKPWQLCGWWSMAASCFLLSKPIFHFKRGLALWPQRNMVSGLLAQKKKVFGGWLIPLLLGIQWIRLMWPSLTQTNIYKQSPTNHRNSKDTFPTFPILPLLLLVFSAILLGPFPRALTKPSSGDEAPPPPAALKGVGQAWREELWRLSQRSWTTTWIQKNLRWFWYSLGDFGTGLWKNMFFFAFMIHKNLRWF